MRKKYPLIQINDEFSIEGDAYQWILHRRVLGLDKEGNDKHHDDKTYHSTLRQVGSYILEQSSKRCETLEDISNLYLDAVSELEIAIRSTVHGT